MTVKLVVLYTPPADVDAFEKHYQEVHVPLVRAMPGLQSFEDARFVAAPDQGEMSYHRIAVLTFADQSALQAGRGSEQARRQLPSTRRSRHRDPACSWLRLTDAQALSGKPRRCCRGTFDQKRCPARR